MRAAVKAARSAGMRVGLVPTMGYLHEGHLTLFRTARAECGLVVVSIFVNPMQFGPSEDYGTYPRDLDRDLSLCRSIPVDAVFVPSVAEMYPQPFLTAVNVSGITETLCGASRPGHFTGVATVVAKLLNIVRPDIAYFGQKDAQQVVVVQRMATDLNLDDIEIRALPTVRESDGLALSSRNIRLTPKERQAAAVLNRALEDVREQAAHGERDLRKLRDLLQQWIEKEPLARVDYVEIVDMVTMRPLRVLTERALVAVAVRIGQTRLIDNIVLKP